MLTSNVMWFGSPCRTRTDIYDEKTRKNKINSNKQEKEQEQNIETEPKQVHRAILNIRSTHQRILPCESLKTNVAKIKNIRV